MFSVNEDGNYEPGFKIVSLEELKVNLVDEYTDSKTRKRNFESMIKILKWNYFTDFQEQIEHIWVDGSFCTNKLDPNDIDVCIEFNLTSLNDLKKLETFINRYTQTKHLFTKLYFDFYPVISESSIFHLKSDFELNKSRWEKTGIDYMLLNHILTKFEKDYDYWKIFFGTDRDNKAKALYAFKYEEVLSYEY